MNLYFKLRATEIVSNELDGNNSVLTLIITFVCIVAYILIGRYEKKLTPDILFTEDKESLGTIEFYNHFFAGQGIPFFIVEDIRKIFYEYDSLRTSGAGEFGCNVSKLHADDDFSLIWGFDPQEFIKKGVREKFGIKIDSYEVYYGVHTFRELVNFVNQNLKPPSFTILCICADNSCVSIMAEALTNYFGRGRFSVFSAGSHPVEKVNTYTLSTLENNGLPVGGYSSKSWDEFADKKIDLVITLSASAADEIFPAYLNSTTRVHWEFPDPSLTTGAEDEIAKAFQTAYDALAIRIKQMLTMPLETMQPTEISRALNRVGSES